MKAMTLRLPDGIDKAVTQAGKEVGLSKAGVIRLALAKWIKERKGDNGS